MDAVELRQQRQKTAAEILRIAAGSKVNPQATLRALLASENTFATVLLAIVADAYLDEGEEEPWWSWHPTTLRMQIEEDFQVRLPKENLDKLLAAIALVTTNYFYKDVSRFIQLCNILSGDDFDPELFDWADAAEVLWGITEAGLLYPPDPEDPEDSEFSPEIRGYIAFVLESEGIALPPDALRLGGAGMDLAGNFEDDPEMFQAVWAMQASRRDDLMRMLRENLQELVVQLDTLPLTNGSTADLVQQIRRVVD